MFSIKQTYNFYNLKPTFYSTFILSTVHNLPTIYCTQSTTIYPLSPLVWARRQAQWLASCLATLLTVSTAPGSAPPTRSGGSRWAWPRRAWQDITAHCAM